MAMALDPRPRSARCCRAGSSRQLVLPAAGGPRPHRRWRLGAAPLLIRSAAWAAACGGAAWRLCATGGFVLPGGPLPQRHDAQQRWATGRSVLRRAISPDKESEDALDLLYMLERPGAADDLKEMVKRMLSNPEYGGQFNATVERIRGASQGEDPFARLLEDPDALARIVQDPEQAAELARSLNSSAIFQDLKKMGSTFVEQLRIKDMASGRQVEIRGLKGAPELNGRIGTLREPTEEESASFPERRIVEVDGDRIAVRMENLCEVRFKLGDAVTLEAAFEGIHEGLDGRAAVISEPTEEEIELGLTTRGGRVVVDAPTLVAADFPRAQGEVLPLVKGFPVQDRFRMWPEQLRARRFKPGDAVELTGLQGDAGLNGAEGTVVPAEEGEMAEAPDGAAVVELEGGGRRLLVRRQNMRLTWPSLGPVRGFR